MKSREWKEHEFWKDNLNMVQNPARFMFCLLSDQKNLVNMGSLCKGFFEGASQREPIGGPKNM
jgi:hypothetical protein